MMTRARRSTGVALAVARWVADTFGFPLTLPCAAARRAFEDNGDPTDITASLAKGTSRVGYSKRYADNWSRIFGPASGGRDKSAESAASPPPGPPPSRDP